VKVDFQGQRVTVKAAENGKWTVWLKPLVAAGPLEMNINDVLGTLLSSVRLSCFSEPRQTTQGDGLSHRCTKRSLMPL
jgi:hypothetical protein